MGYYEVNRLSSSDIKLLSESVQHWLAYKDADPTPEMEFGTAFHAYILNQSEFKQKYQIGNINRRTNQGKAMLKEAEENGIKLLSLDDYEIIQRMSESYFKLKLDFHIGKIEEPIYFDYLDVACKAKPDVVQEGVTIDFKTINDCSDEAIRYAVKRYKYYIQNTFYNIATGNSEFYFIFCEKKPPYGVRVVTLQNHWLEEGIKAIHNAIERYKFYLAGYEEPAYEIFLTI